MVVLCVTTHEALLVGTYILEPAIHLIFYLKRSHCVAEANLELRNQPACLLSAGIIKRQCATIPYLCFPSKGTR